MQNRGREATATDLLKRKRKTPNILTKNEPKKSRKNPKPEKIPTKTSSAIALINNGCNDNTNNMLEYDKVKNLLTDTNINKLFSDININ